MFSCLLSVVSLFNVFFFFQRFELLQVYAGHSDMIFSLATSNGIVRGWIYCCSEMLFTHVVSAFFLRYIPDPVMVL